MSYKGTVKNGVVVLEPGAKLAEGTCVSVEPDPKGEAGVQDLDPAWRIGELAKPTGIPDLATNADHYLYGHPKVGDAR
jgi:hypothetical protein